MSGKRKEITAQGIVFLCTGLLFAVFFLGETDLLGPELWPHQRILHPAVFLALILLMPFLIRPLAGNGKLRGFLSRSETRNLLILTALAVIPRIIWGLAVPTRIDSDYGLYVRMGQTEEARQIITEFFKKTSVTMIICYLGFLIFGVSLFVPVVSGGTPLPRWACIFNILPLMLALMPTRVGGAGNWAGAIMFLGLFFLL